MALSKSFSMKKFDFVGRCFYTLFQNRSYGTKSRNYSNKYIISDKNKFSPERLTKKSVGCSPSSFNDQKGNTASKRAASRIFDFHIDPPQQLTNVLQQIYRQRQNVVFIREILTKKRWGCSPSIFDDQKRNPPPCLHGGA